MRQRRKLSGDWNVLSRLMWSKPLMVADVNKASLRRLLKLGWVKVTPKSKCLKVTNKGTYEYRRLLVQRQTNYHTVERDKAA